MDEVAVKRAILKGEQTKRLIEAHAEAWAGVEADIVSLWRASKPEDGEFREQLWHEHHAIRAVQARLQRAVNEGKKAEHELQQMKLRQQHGN